MMTPLNRVICAAFSSSSILHPPSSILHPPSSILHPPSSTSSPQECPMPWKTTLHSVSYAGVWPGQTRLTLEAFLEKAKALGYDGVMLMAKRPHLSLLDADAAARRRLRDKLASL